LREVHVDVADMSAHRRRAEAPEQDEGERGTLKCDDSTFETASFEWLSYEATMQNQAKIRGLWTTARFLSEPHLLSYPFSFAFPGMTKAPSLPWDGAPRRSPGPD